MFSTVIDAAIMFAGLVVVVAAIVITQAAFYKLLKVTSRLIERYL